MVNPDPVRRYFDNAATSHPKPPEVLAAVRDYFERVHASAGRGAYREAIESGRLLDDCRTALRELFQCRPADHVIFTLNGSDALNLALKSVLRPGQHVLTTAMDHNSVLRPLNALAEQIGVRWTPLPVDPQTTRLDPAALATAIGPDTRLVVINHASNVTGVLQPLDALAEVCHRRGVPLLLDAAQSAGHVPIEFGRLPIDLLACPGHKGLLGPLGTGVLLIREGFEARMRTVREGGTGSRSEDPVQPPELPDRFEAGSHNAPGIAGLLASVKWLLATGVANVRRHELELIVGMAEHLDRIPGLRWFGPREPEHRVGVFSVRLGDADPAEVAAQLETRFGVLTRSGLHCAPLAHQTLGTLATGGTTRLSLGPFLGSEDVAAAAAALESVAAAPELIAPATRVPLRTPG